MTNNQVELVNEIVRERKEIDALKQKIELLEDKYYRNLVKLYDSVKIIDKEIDEISTYYNKRLYKGKLIDKE